jgi:hypothetical protein
VFFNREVRKRLTKGRSSRQHESQYGNLLHRGHPQFSNPIRHLSRISCGRKHGASGPCRQQYRLGLSNGSHSSDKSNLRTDAAPCGPDPFCDKSRNSIDGEICKKCCHFVAMVSLPAWQRSV